MATTLAAQLSIIAADSENSLNLKALNAKHSKSLIFEPLTAASQTFETIYTICQQGFQELCVLDSRFIEFQNDLFSEQSQEQDRSQMTMNQNIELDKRLEAFLFLVSRRLRLLPAIQAVEWLVRRFRIHECNTSTILQIFLPYHTLPIFTTLLSILPTKIPETYKFLQPYIRSLKNPSRHVIVQAAVISSSFASTFNTFILNMCKVRYEYPSLISFWASVMTEAIACMLDRARSGRKSVQLQNEQDVILKILPVLKEGLALKDAPNLRLACFILISVIALKGNLSKKLLAAIMEAIVFTWTDNTAIPSMVCLSLIAEKSSGEQLSKKLTKRLIKNQNFFNILLKISRQQQVDKLASGICLAILHRFEKKKNFDSLYIVESIIENDLLNKAQLTVIVKSLLKLEYEMDEKNDEARSNLANLIANLIRLPNHVGSTIRATLSEALIDLDELELKLQVYVRASIKTDVSSNGKPEKSDNKNLLLVHSPSEMLKQLPKKIDNEISFLSTYSSQNYFVLSSSFLACAQRSDHLSKFDEIPILQRNSACHNPFYLSFYMRIWCSPSPVSARFSALQMAVLFLSESESGIDFQAVIPYTITALSDPSHKVRSGAAKLVLALNRLYSLSTELMKLRSYRLWGKENIYATQDTTVFSWLSTDVAARFVNDVLKPELEECELDHEHIKSVIETSLGSRVKERLEKSTSAQLSQSSRRAILCFLASHITHTPLFNVKLRLLECVNQVHSIGSVTRTRFLLPVLQNWVMVPNSQIAAQCKEELIDMTNLEEYNVMVITAKAEDGIQFLHGVIEGRVGQNRPTLKEAVFKRIEILWTSLSRDLQFTTAKVLLAISESLQGDDKDKNIYDGATNLLQKLSLSSDILSYFLRNISISEKLLEMVPAVKKRKTSYGDITTSHMPDAVILKTIIWKLTFILQLVDDSVPSKHPKILEPLFDILAQLQDFKYLIASELAYLQHLVLSSILATLKAYEANKSLKINESVIQANLLVDCVQKTTNLRVQNVALLVISSLAHIVPHLVLHSVMPIFTFIGSSVLQQNDGYSTHVINQTIREVIPPLITSLRNEKKSPITGASELLLSFVAAYEHVPVHRRRGLYLSLIQALGPQDFLFVLLALLVEKYGYSRSMKEFALETFGTFSVEIQLLTIINYIDLIVDIMKPRPNFSQILLVVNNEMEKAATQIALTELSVLPDLLSQKQLISQVGKILSVDDMNASKIRNIYSTLVEKLLAFSDQVEDNKMLHNSCGVVLESILNLLSTSEFLISVESLLKRPNQSIRRKVLRSLEARIDNGKSYDNNSRAAMLGFLSQLIAIIQESQDAQYKIITINCVEKISKKYGKTDLEAVRVAAETIASKYCLGQSDDELQVVALLCLASLVSILKEEIISILPSTIETALQYLKDSMQSQPVKRNLCMACYTFFSTLTRHLPFMISGADLDKLLEISNLSATTELGDENSSFRMQFLSLAARNIDPKNMLNSLERHWLHAASLGPSIFREHLNCLRSTISHSDKIVIAKNSQILTKIIQNTIDLRRHINSIHDNRFTKNLINELESFLNEMNLEMIHKLNNATFRPLFTNLVDWAVTNLQKEEKIGRTLRLQGFYSLLTAFFDNLKSIVTSYASYFIENAVEILHSVDNKEDLSKELWVRVLRTLVKCFEHDQDEFWQAPAHFNAVAPVLCAQFSNALSLPLIQELIPAILGLASAVDSPDHYKQINNLILKNMRSENASVRLATILCQQKLTERLGEEWLSMLPEMLPVISELQEDDDEAVEKETHNWIMKIEEVLGESLDSMLQ